jgi:hypothetical protein
MSGEPERFDPSNEGGRIAYEHFHHSGARARFGSSYIKFAIAAWPGATTQRA